MLKKHRGHAIDSLLLAFVRALTYISSIIQTMIMSRVFSKFEYGRYAQACLVASFLAPLFLLGLSNAINYFYNNSKTNRESYISTIYNLIIGISFLGGVLIILSRFVIARYFNNESLVPLIYIVAFRPLLQNLLSMIQVLYISSGRAKTVAIRNTILSIAQLIIVVIAAYLLKNITLVLSLLVLTDFIQVLILGFYLHIKVIKLHFFYLDRGLIPEILKYAIPLALSTMVGTISLHMDMLLIGRLLSTEQFALYSNMAKELPFNFLVASFTDVVFPIVIKLKSKGKNEELVKLYKAYVQFGLITTLIMISCAAICSREIILILYSEKYIEGEMIFIVYLLVSFLRFTYCGMLLSASGQSKKILVASVLSLCANLVLNIVLFYALGMIGPAIATVIAVLLANYLQMIWGCKTIGSKLKDIIDFKKIGTIFLEAIMMGIFLRFGIQYFSNIPTVIRFAVISLLNAGILLLLNKNTIVCDLRQINTPKIDV